jgi:hypothetical protein
VPRPIRETSMSVFAILLSSITLQGQSLLLLANALLQNASIL